MSLKKNLSRSQPTTSREVQRELGEKSKRVYADVPQSQHKAFSKALVEDDTSMRDVVRTLVALYLDNPDTRAAVRARLRLD